MDKFSERHCSDVDDMEQTAKDRIITMNEEKPESLSKQYLQEIQDKISELYEEFRIWLSENQESESVMERKEKLKAESDKLIYLAKSQIKKIKENENFQETLEKGATIATNTTLWVGETICDGVDEVMKNESIQKFSHSVEEVFQQVRNDERVKESVKTLKKGTLKFAENAMNELKKVLDTEESEIEEQDNEKNNYL